MEVAPHVSPIYCSKWSGLRLLKGKTLTYADTVLTGAQPSVFPAEVTETPPEFPLGLPLIRARVSTETLQNR